MIHTFTILGAAEAGATESVSSIVVIGFSFVLTVLAVLAAVTAIMGMVFSKRAARDAEKAAAQAKLALEKANSAPAPAKAAAPAATPAPVAAPVPAPQEEDDAAILAVISAAVHTVIGDRAHRIVSVRGAGSGWAQEGRRQIFSSHRVR